MPKWQNLYVTYLERYCVLLYQNPPLGHQSPGACSLSCQPAPSESKWWFLVYVVKRHFVMSCSVRASVAASWCCQLAQWCNLLLPSEFWQKQSNAAWHRHLRARGDVREPEGESHTTRARKLRRGHKQHSADHQTSLHDPVYNVRTADWAEGRFWFSVLALEWPGAEWKAVSQQMASRSGFSHDTIPKLPPPAAGRAGRPEREACKGLKLQLNKSQGPCN